MERSARQAGIAGPPLFILVWIIVGLLDTKFSFLTGHGSDLALGSWGWLMTLNFIVVGLLEIVFAAMLLIAGSRVLGILVVVVGLSLVVSGAFPTDAVGHSATTAGSIHNAAFPLLFLALVVAAVYSAAREGGGWRIHSIITAFTVIGGTLGFVIAASEPGDPLYRVGGIVQLLLVAVGFAWLTRLAVMSGPRAASAHT